MEILIFIRFIMSCEVPFLLAFLRKVFGKLRPLSEFLMGDNLRSGDFDFVD